MQIIKENKSHTLIHPLCHLGQGQLTDIKVVLYNEKESFQAHVAFPTDTSLEAPF